jgi:hypothetical protein
MIDSTTPRTRMRRQMTAGSRSSDGAMRTGIVPVLLPAPCGGAPPAKPVVLHPPRAHAAVESIIYAASGRVR